METSLRYGKDSTALKLHAKQKFPVHANTLLQLNGELNTKIGAPSYFSALIRHFFPLKASVGVGFQYDRREKLRYTARGKKAFPVTADESVNFIIKGRTEADTKFKQTTSKGAAELSWSILNFQKEQDVRLKVGYDILDKIPYVQIRENNWTFNADINGKWNVRYDL